jgi:lipid A ethanolaminephosphotransferase
LTATEPNAATGAPRPFTIDASVEQLVLGASLFWALSANHAFFSAALAGRSAGEVSAWGFGAALFVIVLAVHALLLGSVASRWTVKPVLAGLTLVAAGASHFMGSYGVILDPSMLRNVLHTEFGEARELLTPALGLHLLLYAVAPLLLLWRVRVRPRRWPRALLARAAFAAAAAAVAVGALLAVFQPFASLMRTHKEVRYLITPANVLWSVASTLAADARGAAVPRQAIGLDAAPGPSWAARRKPVVVVLVVGETARAANWGLNGGARQTTPRLAQLPVVNFPEVTACGSNTEVSVPCLFAPVGRRDYDEARIRGQESLLHVVARAGVGVHWRDNQTGCKGVCDGLPNDRLDASLASGLCDGERCLDEGLLADFETRLDSARGTQLWVLHTLGNHGPAYHRRYPRSFARFQPECRDDDLRQCSVEAVANAYDNALLYTDHVLATAITRLQAHADRVDSALVYVSDHGESLGEHGLFLHGLPYAIAPREQTRVPMVVWASAGLERAAGMSAGCLRPTLAARAAGPVSHDHLFHTLLGLLDVRTTLHDPAWDLTRGCRAGDTAAAQAGAAPGTARAPGTAPAAVPRAARQTAPQTASQTASQTTS